MQFLYSPEAPKETITLKGDEYRYVVKVRRFGEGDRVNLRNMEDDYLYEYEIREITKRELLLKLINSTLKPSTLSKELHLLWCVIDPKVMEKTLPMLNQLGVKKISFIYCQRSQKNFKLDRERVKKILINSSQQCGRSDLMEIEILASLDDALESYDDIKVLDFGGETEWGEVKRGLIGCEGGFSDEENSKLSKLHKIGLNTPLVLKSETAVLTFCIKSLI